MEYGFSLSLGVWESIVSLRMLMWRGGWNVLARPHHFDCTFHLEWIRWGGKQTIHSINVGLVSLMNSFYCTLPSWQMIANQCSFFCSLFFISPSISSFHSKSLHYFSFYAPSSLFFPIWLITSYISVIVHPYFHLSMAHPAVLPSLNLYPLCRHWPVLQLHGGVQGPGSFRPLLDAVLRAVWRAPGAGLPQQPARARHGCHAAWHWGTLLRQPLRPTDHDLVLRLVQR